MAPSLEEVLVNTEQLAPWREQTWFVAFAHVRGIKTPRTTDFKIQQEVAALESWDRPV